MRGVIGRKDMRLLAQNHRRDSKRCKKVPCNRRQAVCVLFPGKGEAMQYEGVKCIRDQVLHNSTTLNGCKLYVQRCES